MDISSFGADFVVYGYKGECAVVYVRILLAKHRL